MGVHNFIIFYLLSSCSVSTCSIFCFVKTLNDYLLLLYILSFRFPSAEPTADLPHSVVTVFLSYCISVPFLLPSFIFSLHKFLISFYCTFLLPFFSSPLFYFSLSLSFYLSLDSLFFYFSFPVLSFLPFLIFSFLPLYLSSPLNFNQNWYKVRWECKVYYLHALSHNLLINTNY